eukprot:scaffold232177_cov17-Cyclotella_meneghiniana.AAC.1
MISADAPIPNPGETVWATAPPLTAEEASEERKKGLDILTRESLKLRKYKRISLSATASEFSMPTKTQSVNRPDVSVIDHIVGK